MWGNMFISALMVGYSGFVWGLGRVTFVIRIRLESSAFVLRPSLGGYCLHAFLTGFEGGASSA